MRRSAAPSHGDDYYGEPESPYSPDVHTGSGSQSPAPQQSSSAISHQRHASSSSSLPSSRPSTSLSVHRTPHAYPGLGRSPKPYSRPTSSREQSPGGYSHSTFPFPPAQPRRSATASDSDSSNLYSPGHLYPPSFHTPGRGAGRPNELAQAKVHELLWIHDVANLYHSYNELQAKNWELQESIYRLITTQNSIYTELNQYRHRYGRYVLVAPVLNDNSSNFTVFQLCRLAALTHNCKVPCLTWLQGGLEILLSDHSTFRYLFYGHSVMPNGMRLSR